MKTPPFVPLPDPIQESEVNPTLQWIADSRTSRAIERQAKLIGVSPNVYLRTKTVTPIKKCR